ncbi:hypothetical protein RZO55_19485 [Clostridium boliviensis]|uniref:Uncharacterized protein n=1 Tax=Clostridium boliviensis TaxID=318465 RepID=A0ABU4GQ50_9CLOT|nr:hypothetical protein [Clostridium boliviensis]MDW2799761.1 hypothetical protein [Clostridium boliviensis]
MPIEYGFGTMMLSEIFGVAKIYIITGRIDMTRSIVGIMGIFRDTYQTLYLIDSGDLIRRLTLCNQRHKSI